MFLNTNPLEYVSTKNWSPRLAMDDNQPKLICSFASDNGDDRYSHGEISSFNGKLFFIDYDYNSSVERKDGTWQETDIVYAIVSISEMPSVWKGLSHVRLDSDGMENRAIKEVLTDGGKKELCFATEEEAKPFLKDFEQQATETGAAFSDQRKTKRGEQYWKELPIEKPVPFASVVSGFIDMDLIAAEIAQEAAACTAKYLARKAKRPHTVPVRPDLEHAVNS